jgi:hypothetical protein
LMVSGHKNKNSEAAAGGGLVLGVHHLPWTSTLPGGEIDVFGSLWLRWRGVMREIYMIFVIWMITP